MIKTKILGHRGAMGSAPENTLPSFRKAIEESADGVEFDVQLSADGLPVVIHDEALDRTTNAEGPVNALTARELRELDAGSFFSSEFNGANLPLLKEVLEVIQDMDIINLELKNGNIRYEGMEEKVIGLTREYGVFDKTIFSSFNHYSIKKIKEIEPAARTGVLYMAGIYRPWEYAKKLGAEAIHPFYAATVPEIVEECHKHDMAVNAFGANDDSVIRQLLMMNVDAIITDYPARAREILDEINN
ncbi:glycerophosphodiester phosphodiesterase [Halanaerobiaceae bacterium Z-7014]|uniref:Glycerophosphodiester phosphodiesterase n=1 Tax=Halonatronomonas betaini TaxID=2778430 RepID=A0A931FBL6_9FIRM|nr:glycerophosphodiester phosphodiesterase [Halonatronomonas betaini]MBF8438102.1 glycerophosphodiester phosphodiesterase [Halonatronomonas betaini]